MKLIQSCDGAQRIWNQQHRIRVFFQKQWRKFLGKLCRCFSGKQKKEIFEQSKWKRNKVFFHGTKYWPGKKAENPLVVVFGYR